MKITSFILLFAVFASALATFADVPAEKPRYLVEAKITEESQSANGRQAIQSIPKITLSLDSAGAIGMIEKRPIGDLADKPSPGIILQAIIKEHDGALYLSVKTTICKVADQAKPNAEDVAWITTRNTDTWICAKLDTMPKVIKTPDTILDQCNYSIDITVTQVDRNGQPLPDK